MREWKRLWKISKYTFQEIFIETQLQMAGATQTRLLEELEKNRKYIKIQEITMKIVLMLYIAGLIVFPLQIFSKIDYALSLNYPTEWVLWAGSLLFGIFFISEFLIIVTFGLIQASGLLSGVHFQWLTTLPISKADIQKISLFTFFRGLDTQLIAALIVLPVGVVIATGNILLVFLSILLSVGNVLFCFGCLVLIGERLHRVLDEKAISTPKNNTIRLVVLSSYVIVLIVGALGIQLSFLYIDSIFSSVPSNLASVNILNTIFPFIAFPFSGAYLLIHLYIFPIAKFSLIALFAGIGCVLFFVWVVRIFRKSLFKLKNVLWLQNSAVIHDQTDYSIENVNIRSVKPEIAFFNKDKQFASRDLQVAMMFIMPFILPILSLISVAVMGIEDEIGIDSLVITNFSMNFMYSVMSAVLIIYGLMNIEVTGSTILGALPIRVRDQTKGKILWLAIILGGSSLVQILIYIGNPIFFINMVLTLVTFPLGFIIGILTLELKVFLFGKMKYKYVLEDVRIKHKIWKWVLISMIDFLLYGVILGIITTFLILNPENYLLPSSLVLVVITVITGLGAYWIYNKQFPQ